MNDAIVVVGAGAIGGTVAAYLVRQGLPIVLVDANLAHVQAINERGLVIHAYNEEFTVKLKADTPDSYNGSLNGVFLATKALHTGQAMDWITPRLSPSGYVVSMQNGLNERLIADRVGPGRTIGCFVNFSSDVMAPGVIDYGGPGTFAIGELNGPISDRIRELVSFITPFIPPIATDNIWGYLWSKLAYGAVLFATATTDETMADCVDHPRYRSVLLSLGREVIGLATRQNIHGLPFDGWDPGALEDVESTQEMMDRLSGVMRKNLKVRSGVWRDLAVHHRKTEIDAQYGPVLEVAKEFDYPMPMLDTLVAIIHELESNKASRGWHNLERLREASA